MDTPIPFGEPIAESEREERRRAARLDAPVYASRTEYVRFQSPSLGAFVTTTERLTELSRYLPEDYRSQLHRYILTNPRRLAAYPCTDGFGQALRDAQHKRDAVLNDWEEYDTVKSNHTSDATAYAYASAPPDNKPRDPLPNLRLSHVIAGKRVVLVAPSSTHGIDPGDRYALVRDPEPVPIFDPNTPDDHPMPRDIIGYVDTFGYILTITRTVPGSRIVFATLADYVREDPHTINALFANFFGTLKIERGMRARPVTDDDLKNAHLYDEAPAGTYEPRAKALDRIVENTRKKAEVVIDDPSLDRERHP